MDGSGPVSRRPGALIGRGDDLEVITAFADQAAVSGGALLLVVDDLPWLDRQALILAASPG
jgi:hypothetical protein